MKKFFISILLFLSFFNGVASNDYKDKNLRDNHEATIEIESARKDQDSLQISWKITGVENIDKVIEINQQPIGRTPRSNPATYCGIFSEIRNLLSITPEAKIRGYKPGRFSFNVVGWMCETCKGAG